MTVQTADVSIQDGTITVSSGLHDTDDGIKLEVAGDAYPRIHFTPQGDIKTGDGTAAPVVAGATWTGWASYADTTYTSGSPRTLTADNDVRLTNNAANTIESQLPTDLTSMYDETADTNLGRILGVEGDGYMITVDLQASCASPSGASLELWFNIGGSVGELYRTTLTSFPKGTATHGCTRTIGVYTLDTWEANGAAVWIRPNNQNVNIWNIRYVIHRTHKAR